MNPIFVAMLVPVAVVFGGLLLFLGLTLWSLG